MAFRSASLSRSLMSTARASLRQAAPSSPLPRLRPPPLAAPRVQSRRFSMPASRNLGQLGCIQSLLPLTITCMTSHVAVSARACCELSHGTFRRSCQDR
ncbi:hypothetical protein AAZX31_10G248000 [Glycine max]|uniref:Uncharacterized protein n=2 Tax=Glycine max TaxID=3847 RepID=A0A0R0HZF9_SOYBN|nr:hypothetical protein GYH30_029171 [Glycine max]KRH35719.1 hypothetical protein GLYMA_10G260750v4 [Glycine max]